MILFWFQTLKSKIEPNISRMLDMDPGGTKTKQYFDSKNALNFIKPWFNDLKVILKVVLF